MARYDRIAPLPSPPRDRAIPAWPVLRDLEGRERDTDLARRVRLRFLALRPVRRLATRGIERVPAPSFQRQVEAVRAELGVLPANDPERSRLARFLHQIGKRTPLAVTAATLDMGEVLEEGGHLYGAEEFYRTALQLAEAYGLTPQRVIAHRLLGRVLRALRRWPEATESYRVAVELSRTLDAAEQWCRSMDGLAAAYREEGRFDDARRVYGELLDRGQDRSDALCTATALAGLCRTELDAGDPDRAVELGWLVLPRTVDAEQRHLVLRTLGLALTKLGLYTAAERCHGIVAERTAVPATRVQALLDLARVAAYVGRSDLAGDRLRRAIAEAGRHGLGRLLGQAEELLSDLERGAAGERVTAPVAASPSEQTRRIAAEIEALDTTLVPASG
jgi:tetratricopeptide (TPR) repeat protein